MIPVDEINVGELAAVQRPVLDGHGLAPAEEHAAQMPVGVHAGIIAGLPDIPAELRVQRAGVAVLVLLGIIGDQPPHDIEQVVLEVFQIEGIQVMGTLLDHDRAGRMVRRDAAGAVFDAGRPHDLQHLPGHVVEGGDPAP